MKKSDITPLIENISDPNFINSYIPGGILKAKCDEYFTILEANSGYFDLLGYSKEEIRDIFANRGLATLHPDDAAPAAEELMRQIKSSPLQKFNVNCRLANKNCGYNNVQFSGRLVTEKNGEQNFYFHLMDITEHINITNELKRERDFNLLIASFTENVFFDYNINTKSMRFSENFASRLGIPSVIEDYPEPLIRMGAVSEIDMQLHKANYLISKDSVFESEAKFKLKNGDFLWYLCQYKVLCSSAGVPERVVGKMIDITSQKTQIDELTHQALTDQLTGVYNKMATQKQIEEYLIMASYTNAEGALLIIDIDNFKDINDTFGHSYGDAVITEVAHIISKKFRQDDIVGRLGGDEFFVFMKGSNYALVKADEICRALRKTYEQNGVQRSISASIGIAVFPEYGRTFEQLYVNADIALYIVKSAGKNGYKMFDGEERQSYKNDRLPD